MIRRYLVILSSLCLLLSGNAFAQDAKTSPRERQLYEAAKKEGEVRIWGGTNVPVIAALADGFAKSYPGIAIKPFEITPSALVQRLILQKVAGAPLEVDLIQAELDSVRPLLDRKMLASYDDWEATFPDLPKNVFGNGGVSVKWADNDQPVAYNTNLVKGDLPTSWEDLLDPKWKGKILVERRGKQFAHLLFLWGEAKFQDYMSRLATQKLFYVNGGTTLAQNLATGEGAIALGTYGFSIVNLERQGAPVSILPIKPVRTRLINNYVVKDSKNADAARLFAAWLATPDGQRVLDESWGGRGLLTAGSSAFLAQTYQKLGFDLDRDLIDLADVISSKDAIELEKKAMKALAKK